MHVFLGKVKLVQKIYKIQKVFGSSEQDKNSNVRKEVKSSDTVKGSHGNNSILWTSYNKLTKVLVGTTLSK